MNAKTDGQLAYEAELLIWPNYPDGAPRKTWDRLSEIAKGSWEKNPTPRKVNATPEREQETAR
ncbi:MULTISPECIES: hypothetical protein [unclassified Bradyrhizobium]|uniref:hypothetical protein n=1 Tax=unclassified Bradyrhizobium TaxID=2631580 RepID=UPI0028E36689|nr:MULTISPECIES: hypothetical protein [unclassified Bradyrhizobium]